MNITEKRLKDLERAEAKLAALEAGGVDNWDFYDESLKEYRQQNELEERREDLLSDLATVFGEYAYEPSERGAGVAFTDEAMKQGIDVLINAGVFFKD